MKSLTGRLGRMLGSLLGKSSSGSEEYIEEEIISMVNEGRDAGVIHESEVEMIENIFDFTDKEAKDVMTNRRNIDAVDGTTNLVLYEKPASV